MIERIRVSKPGHAERLIPRRELADAIASGWVPVWNQSLETLAQQVDVLREAVVDLADSTAAPMDPTPSDSPGAGANGKSAYELAVEQGFSGTVQQWLASLEGPPGPPGDDGAPGADSTVPGPQGPPGPASTVPGPAGADGKSAYQLARDGGYGGTQTQWLASLASTVPGPPGPPGTTDYTQLTNKPTLGTAAAKDTGTGATQVILGNDARLTDARTPTAHTHPAAQVTGLATVATTGAYGDLSGRPTLATVATTGDYNDLANKPASGSGPLVAKTAADQPFTTVTLANITGLSFAAAANTAYQFEALLSITSAATTTGWQFGITAPAVTSFLAVCDYQSSATAWTAATLTAPGGFTLVTAAYAAATPMLVRITGLVVPSSAGTVQFQCRSEVAGSAITVKRGAVLTVT